MNCSERFSMLAHWASTTSTTWTSTYRCPLDADGPYYLFLCTDTLDQVYEGNAGGEDNNCAGPQAIAIEYRAPDLQVASVLVIADDPALSGTPIAVEWVVSNEGDWRTRSSSWWDRIYISTDEVLDSGDPLLATQWETHSLEPGESYADSRVATIPLSFTASTAYVFVCTDVHDEEYELEEDNNCTSSTIPFEVVWGPADLGLQRVDVLVDGLPVSSVQSGTVVTVEWEGYNFGPGATSASTWSDRIRISNDEVLDATDPILATQSHTGALAGDESYTAARDVEIPVGFTSSSTYIFVEIDSASAVVDPDPSNNVDHGAAFEVVWGDPDLIVESVSAVHGTPHGEVIDLSWTVRNLGGATVVAEWQDAVYLSGDRWLSIDDQELETPNGPLTPHLGALEYDETYSRTEPISVPLGSTGYLIVATDASDPDQVIESDEGNNEAHTALPSLDCDSDLVVVEVDAPPTALSGQLMTIEWTVMNQGSQSTNTGTWRDAVYVSPDEYLDPGADYYLGYLNHAGVLDAGAGYTPPAAFDVSVPPGLTGLYYVFVIADSANHVCETDEDNNVGHDLIQIELPPPADLVVTDIVVPSSATLGEPVTIQWTVENAGAFQAQGSWRDTVYVSADTTWDITDKRIGKVLRAGPLDPNASYTESLTAPLPGVVPGDYYIVVRTDIHNEVRESAAGEQNNITPSADQVSVTCSELALGDVVDSQVLSTRTEHYYKIPDVPGDEPMLIWLDCVDNSASTELFVRHGAVPDRGRYDFAHSIPFTDDHEIVIQPTLAGDYYVLVRGDDVPAGPSPYTLGARLLEFEIRGIVPSQAGNAGSVTTLIQGGQLSPDTVARLVNGRTVVEGVIWPGGTPTEMYATFDLTGVPPGDYDVQIEEPGRAQDTLPLGMAIAQGTGPNLAVHLLAPAALRAGQPFELYIEYGNIGDADLLAPLFSLSGPNSVSLRLYPNEDPWTGPVQVLGISTDGPPSILRPGMWHRIPAYGQAPGSPGSIVLELGMLTADPAPIEWDELEQELRPDSIPAELWAALWANLTTAIGGTWADFLTAMNDSAAFLASVGDRTYDVRELFAAVVRSASGDLGLRLPLAVRVDAYSAAPGLPLAFVPVATNNLAQRFHVGPLGRGWSHNFEYSLTRLDDDNIVVSLPGGFTRSFTRQPDDFWRGSPGDYGTLEDLGDDTYQITEKYGLIWFFAPGGYLAYIDEPNGNYIALSYSADRLVEVSHSNGQQLVLDYNDDGRLIRLTDHVGRQTEYLYDNDTGEHLVQVVAPGNRESLYDYNAIAGASADHALNAITFPDGTHLYYGYDSQGRLAEVSRDGGAEQFLLTYDELGTVRVADAAGGVSTLWLGADRELLVAENAAGSTWQLGYDAEFNLTQLSVSDGSEYEFYYDTVGNFIEGVDPLDGVITLGHTSDLNRLDWLRDARNNLMDFTSDSWGNLTGIIHPDTSSELFGRDGRGLVTTVKNRRGQTITYTHDPEGRLTQKALPPDAVYPAGRITDYGYDAYGNLNSVVDSLTGAILLEWDDRDFLTRIEYPGNVWFTFEYNDAGWRTRRTGHDGFVLDYGYDEAGRLQTLTDGTGHQIIEYGYDAVGRLVREDKGNGTYTTYEYDAAGQVLHLVNYYAPDGAVQSRFDYEYDANGNPISMATLEGTWYYGYDLTGQLADVTHSDGHHVTYEYDLAGNRITVTNDGMPTAYTTNELNQYTQVGNVTYGYDADGNVSSKTDAMGTTLYEYDVENQLARVITPADGTWEYTYDGLGNRIAVSHDGVVTSYAHDPIGLVDVAAEYHANGVLAARYVHGIGLIARRDAADVDAYYAFDATGHTRQLTDDTAAVANTYSYDPFGVPLDMSEGVANPFRYVGRFGVMNEENGLDFMRARYYDSSDGRLLTPDPISIGGGMNLYSYVENNPVRFIDPLGLKLTIPGNPIKEVIDLLAPFKAGWDYERRHRLAEYTIKGRTAIDSFAGIMQNGATAVSLELDDDVITGTLSTLAPVVLPLILPDIPSDRSAIDIGDIGSPEFPNSLVYAAQLAIIAGFDPNVKRGPCGSGEAQFVPADRSMPYRVDFENLPEASGPAQQIIVTDELGADLDWPTFQLVEIAFGDTVIELAGLPAHYFGEVEVDGGLIARINAGLNIQTGVATWTLTAIDPDTGELPEDPTRGLLPPNDPDVHDGEGYVTFQVRPQAGLPTGTEITNSATIIFDVNEPIDTNEVFNTLDAVAPSSEVISPSGGVPDATFDVTWTDDGDDPGGSGVALCSIYYRMADQPYSLWLISPESAATFTAPRSGAQYDFYSVATDGAGNTESLPLEPDRTVFVYPAVPPAPSVGAVTAVTAQIVGLGSVNANFVEHAVFEEFTGQWVGASGRLTSEALWQPLDQWPGLRIRALLPDAAYSFVAIARSPESGPGSPTLISTSRQGDVNGDGVVTQVDVNLVVQALGGQYGDPDFDPRADLNGDDTVSFVDLGIVRSSLSGTGDFDADGDVDLDDAADFIGCLTGPEAGPVASPCRPGDFDRDDDIDMADVVEFQIAFGGGGR